MKFKASGEKKGDGKLFVRLKDGEKVNGVFRGDPHEYYLHWVEGKSYECGGKAASCIHCEAGDKPRFRFKLNLIAKQDGVWMARILEQGWSVYEALRDLHENGYDLEQTAVSIARTGEGTNTKYTVLPLPKNGGLKEADFAAIHKIPLNVLDPQSDGTAPVAEKAADPVEEDLPF
jgi:hypothetical protein